ncbi:MAG: Uma2 family endonuclease [Waterburya sp.]
MTIITHKWSVEEYHLMIESGLLTGKSVELLNGEIVEISPEREEHSYTNDDVAELLREKLKGLAKIRESHPITLDNSEPETDIAIVRLPKTIYAQRHPYPQDIDWIIEVSNTTLSKDLIEKNTIYARNGIVKYWVIDLVNKKLIVHTDPQGDNYQKVTEYTKGAVKANISPLAFPNLEIALEQLLLS